MLSVCCVAGSKPSVQPHGGSGGRQHKASSVFVILVVLLVIGGIFGAWYHFLASHVARAQVEDVATSVKAFGSSLGGLVADKVGELLGRGGRGGGLGGGSSAAARYVPLDEELNYFQPLPAPAADAAEVVVGVGPPGGSSGGGGAAGNGVYTLR